MLKTVSLILSIVLLVISVAFAIYLFFAGGQVDSDAPFATKMEVIGPALDVALIWIYILIGLAAATSVVFTIVFMITNPQNAFKSLIVVGGLVVVVFLAYYFASDEIMNFHGSDKFFYGEEGIINAETTANAHNFSKKVGTGLIATYIVGILAIFSVIYSGISKAFK